RAIDLGDGPSLADNPAFTEVLEALPSGRHLTGYLGADLLQQAAASTMGAASETGGISLPPGLDPTQALSAMRGIGLAGTMLDEGIRVEMVTVGQLQTDISSGEVGDTNLPDQLPADAIGFFGIGEFDVDAMWGGLMEVLAQIPAEEGQGIDETLAMFGTMLGVDIESDIIGQLTGEIGVGLLPATAGSLVTGSGINLGIIAVMGVEDPGAMAGTVESLAQGIGAMSGGAPAAPRPFDGGTLYALSGEEGEIALFGMAGDHMVITTHESHAAALLAGGDRLAGSARYAEGISGLTGGRPMMYLDIAALISALNLEAAEAAAMAPLHSVAMTGQMDGDISRAVIFARIDY
ncbi:MAG: hypothetical protein H6Q11_1701, partial [Acidobacteria bacterium]|nr:hypothetical protein [Acidobacteriota bacterium]